ncbi:hypothetical protein MVES1_003719 [Malassezia vespertilionis]|uniref:Uncharacterized protein n=1 Tax=Malassezia vespertilionis TaxID=2020962 RepID=A0A2N1J8Q6_9BASI|nr:uncharacterized protein MVES1_003719 [Malassezia vespertilionis]PKI82943.1 hypothetical protein MVES_003279 [Malassezia vespertilionis]WFD08347.1 hypothetical protein MVES1_003719 [Malassezia vespertilionis]
MLRLDALRTLLAALVGSDDAHSLGAHTALLTVYQSADLFAYASALGDAPSSALPAASQHGEARARALAAVSIAAWREHAWRNAAPLSGSTRFTQKGSVTASPEQRSAHRRMGSNPRREQLSASARGRRDSSLDERERSDDTATLPLCIECEYGRLLVLPLHIASLVPAAYKGRETRTSRAHPSPHGPSRRTSYAGSSDNAAVRTSVAVTRSAVNTDESYDTALSTEDELPSGQDTDKESVVASVGRLERRGQDTILLLTLNAAHSDAHEPWQVLLDQALSFAEICETSTAPHVALSPQG